MSKTKTPTVVGQLSVSKAKTPFVVCLFVSLQLTGSKHMAMNFNRFPLEK